MCLSVEREENSGGLLLNNLVPDMNGMEESVMNCSFWKSQDTDEGL